MANKVPLTCFNESKTAKLVISFERQRRDMIRRDFMEKHYLEYFILISKYLINQGMSHEEILILLRKYFTRCSKSLFQNKRHPTIFIANFFNFII